MLSAFNYEKLGSLLKDFYTLTGIRIVVFDDKKKQIAAFPELRPAICNYIRTNPNAECACSACDAIAIDKSSEKSPPIFTVVTPNWWKLLLLFFLENFRLPILCSGTCSHTPPMKRDFKKSITPVSLTILIRLT